MTDDAGKKEPAGEYDRYGLQLKTSKDSPASIGGGGIAPKGCRIPPYMV
jgi:hypothetical protein